MPARIHPLGIHAYTATSAAGEGVAAHTHALRERIGGLRPNDFTRAPMECWIGRVAGVDTLQLPESLAAFDCRNNRLAWLGLNQDGFLDSARAAIARFGATRVALILGTSTASIGATEQGYRELDAAGNFPPALREPTLHNPNSLVHFVQQALGLRGPCVTVSTACSSSAKVFAQAERMLRAGIVDAAIVGGVDSLCDSVLYGFGSLELVSPEPCRPFDAARRGISIGEAAGFALLQLAQDADEAPRLLGYGESSDAFHMSSPHPEGLGARLAIDAALARAGIAAGDIDYINLHGTASQKNDEVEAALIADMFPAHTTASSTKGWTGHTLGAAGIVEAVVSLIALEHGFVPGILNSTELDRLCGPQIHLENRMRPLRHVLSNSFGFGGNNCVLAFGRA